MSRSVDGRELFSSAKVVCFAEHGLALPFFAASARVSLHVWRRNAGTRAQGISNQDLLGGLANPARWLTYSGDYSGRRHSPLTQITPDNAWQLSAQWTFQTGVAGKFEATPIVVDGVLYVGGPMNNAWAIDGRTGRQIWRYQRPVPDGVRACCGMVNRGLAVYGDRVFMGDARCLPGRSRHEDRQSGLGNADR